MHLVQILLPTHGNDGSAVTHDTYAAIRDELVALFGGLTAFTQSPAEGLWKNEHQRTERDTIIMVEVMMDRIDRSWWDAFRNRLQVQLSQQTIVIRALDIEQL